MDSEGTKVDGAVSSELIAATLVMVREIERDPSLAHIIQNYARSSPTKGEGPSKGQGKATSPQTEDAASWVQLLDLGAGAPRHEALPLLLLAVKIALCQCATEDGAKAKVPGAAAALSRLAAGSGSLVPSPATTAKRAHVLLRQQQAKLLHTSPGFLSLGAYTPDLIQSIGRGRFTVAAQSEGFVLMAPSFVKHTADDGDANLSFTVTVTAAGAFQAGWVAVGSDSLLQESGDLRSNSNCCVCDGANLWSGGEEVQSFVGAEESSGSDRHWTEGDVLTCTLDASKKCARFHRSSSRSLCRDRNINTSDVTFSVPLPDAAALGSWRPVVCSPRPLSLGAIYPAVWASHNFAAQQPGTSPTAAAAKVAVATTPTGSTQALGVTAAAWAFRALPSTGPPTAGSVHKLPRRGSVVGSRPLRAGIHRWQLRVHPSGGELRVGVVSEEAALNHPASNSGSSIEGAAKHYCLWHTAPDANRILVAGRRRKRESGLLGVKDDVVWVELNADLGTVTFGTGASGLLVASTADIPSVSGWLPCVQFSAGGSMELLSQWSSLEHPVPELSRTLVVGDGLVHVLKGSIALSCPEKKKNLEEKEGEGSSSAVTSSVSSSALEAAVPAAVTGGGWSLALWVRPNLEQHPTKSAWLALALRGSDLEERRCPGLFVASNDLRVTACVSTASDWNTSLPATRPLVTEQWTHVAVVCSNEALELYLDGCCHQRLELEEPDQEPLGASGPLYLGQCPNGVKRPSADYPSLEGHLANVVYAPRAFTASEVASLAAQRPALSLSIDLSAMQSHENNRLRLTPSSQATLSSSSRISQPGDSVVSAAATAARGFTVEALVVARSLQGPKNLLFSQGSPEGGGVALGVTSSGALYMDSFKSLGSFLSEAGVVSPGQVLHLAWVLEPIQASTSSSSAAGSHHQVRFLVNGYEMVSHGAISATTAAPFAPGPQIGGSKSRSNESGWDGEVLSMRVWREARSELQVRACMTRQGPSMEEAAALLPDLVPIPTCPTQGHPMSVTDGRTSRGYESFACNQCHEVSEKPRWWCSQCRDDFCFACRPGPTKSGTGGGSSSSSGSSISSSSSRSEVRASRALCYWWRCDEGSGNCMYDAASTDADGGSTLHLAGSLYGWTQEALPGMSAKKEEPAMHEPIPASLESSTAGEIVPHQLDASTKVLSDEHQSSEDSPRGELSVRAAAMALLQTLAQSATSFLGALRVENSGRGLGMHTLRAPRASLNPLVTTFKLIGSLLQHLLARPPMGLASSSPPQSQIMSTSLVAILEVLTANLHAHVEATGALKELNLGKPSKAGLGAGTLREQLLSSVMALAEWAPPASIGVTGGTDDANDGDGDEGGKNGYDVGLAVREAAAEALCTGLSVFYPTPQVTRGLLLDLLDGTIDNKKKKYSELLRALTNKLCGEPSKAAALLLINTTIADGNVATNNASVTIESARKEEEGDNVEGEGSETSLGGDSSVDDSSIQRLESSLDPLIRRLMQHVRCSGQVVFGSARLLLVFQDVLAEVRHREPKVIDATTSVGPLQPSPSSSPSPLLQNKTPILSAIAVHSDTGALSTQSDGSQEAATPGGSRTQVPLALRSERRGRFIGEEVNSGAAVHVGPMEGWTTAMADFHFTANSGKQACSFQLMKTPQNDGLIFIGLGDPSQIDPNSFLGACKHSFGWLLKGETYHRNSRISRIHASPFSEGATLTIVAETDDGAASLRFKNETTGEEWQDRDMNHLFARSLSRGDCFSPGVTLYHPGQCVLLTRESASLSSYSSPLAAINPKGAKSVVTKEVPSGQFTPTMAFYGVELIQLALNSSNQEGFHGCVSKSESYCSNESSSSVKSRKEHFPVFLLLLKAWSARVAAIPVLDLPLPLQGAGSTSLLSIVNKALHEADAVRVQLVDRQSFEKIPELEELQALLALVGGRLAAQMVNGECGHSSSKGKESLATAPTESVDTSSGGIENGDSEGLLEAGRADEGTELPPFLLEVCAGTGLGAQLSAFLRKRIGANSFKRLDAQGPELAAALRRFHAAALHHAGVRDSAPSLATRVSQCKTDKELVEIDPGAVLRKVWEKELELRMWCRHLKTSSGGNYLTLAAALDDKAAFLLELLPRCGDSDCSEGQRLGIVDEVVRFLKRKEVSVAKLRARIAASVERATECQRGLDACKELLRFDELPVAAKAAALSTFVFFRTPSPAQARPPSPSSPSSSPLALPGHARHQIDAHHYSEGLSLSGWNARLAVKASMESLFLRLGKELEYALECADLELQLVVLSCWGIALRPEDHALLLSARLFDSLMACLQQDPDDHPTSHPRLALVKRAALKLVVLLATQVATQGEIGAPQPTKAAAHAALPPPMLPVAFKRQVSGTGTFTESIFNLLFEELSAGLGRLKKKTFAAAAIKKNNLTGQAFVASSNKATNDEVSPETLDEILTLLGSIGTTDLCVRVLGASAWLSLLLELAHYASHDATAAASFTLVSDLLPLTQPHRLSDLKLPPVPTVAVRSSNPGSPTSIGGTNQRNVSGTPKQAELVSSSPRRSLQSLAPPQLPLSPPLSPTNAANYGGKHLVEYLLHVAGLGLLPMGPTSSSSPVPLVVNAESMRTDSGALLPPAGLWLAHAAVSVLQKLLAAAAASSPTSSVWAPVVAEELQSALAKPLPSPWTSAEVLANFSRKRVAALAVLNGSPGRFQEGSLVTFATPAPTMDSRNQPPTNRSEYRITAIGRTTATLQLASGSRSSAPGAEARHNVPLARLDLVPPPPLPWAHPVLARLAPLVDADLVQTLDAADHIIDLTDTPTHAVALDDESASIQTSQAVQTSTTSHSNTAAPNVLGEGSHPFHEHPLQPWSRPSGWSCDGRRAPGGCRGTGGGGSGARWRCTQGCDYDLCASCWHQVRDAVARGTLDVRIPNGGRLAVQPNWSVEGTKRALQQCAELPEPLAWVENLRLVSPRPPLQQHLQSSSSTSSGPWHELSEGGGISLASQVVEPDAVLWAVLAPSRAQDAALACLLRRSASLKVASARATSSNSSAQALPYRGATLASLLRRAGRGSMALGLADLPAFEAKQQALVERWYALQAKRRAAAAAEAAALAAAAEPPPAVALGNAAKQVKDTAAKDVDQAALTSEAAAAAAALTTATPEASTGPTSKHASWKRLSLDFSQCLAQSVDMVAGMGQINQETAAFLGQLLNYLLNLLASSAWQEVRRHNETQGSSNGVLTYELAMEAVNEVFETSNMDELLSMASDSMAVRRLQGWEEDQSAWAVASGGLRGLLDVEAAVHGVAGVDEAVAAAFLTCVEVVCVDTFELSVDACEDGDVSSLTPGMIREALVDSDSRIADLINEMESADASSEVLEPPAQNDKLPTSSTSASTSASRRDNVAAPSSLGTVAATAAAAAAAAEVTAAEAAAAEAVVAEKAVAAAMEELSELGFPSAWCEKALAATGPNVEAALAYILENEQSLEEAANTGSEVRDTRMLNASQASGAGVPASDGFPLELPEFGEHPWHIPGHSLELCDRSTGWSCDGRRAPDGCRGDGGGGSQARYRCCDRCCDYDLCAACWQVAFEGGGDLATDFTGELAGVEAERGAEVTATPREEAAKQPAAVVKGNSKS